MTADRTQRSAASAPEEDLRADFHGHVTDFVCDIDRRFFAEHPGVRTYRRPAVDHELCTPGGPCWDHAAVSVIVTELQPGMRARRAA